VSAGYAAAEEGLEASRAEEGRARRLSPWGRLVAASVLVLLAAAASMGGLWAATAGTKSTSFLAAAEVVRVEIDVGRGNVELVGGGLDEVSVRRTDHFAYDHSPEEVRTEVDGVIRITSSCANLLIGSCSADYRVTVSDNVPVVVRTPHGNIAISNYRGSAQLDTTYGSISVSSFCGFVLRATTKAGNIDVATGCSPDRVELRTDTGNVTVSVPEGRYRVDAATTNGSVDVRGVIPSDLAPWSIQALSNTGDVTVLGTP
jgi:putative adhesin